MIKITLEEAKKVQYKNKLDLNEIKKGWHESYEQKMHYIILKCFTMGEMMLLIFLMIILQ